MKKLLYLSLLFTIMACSTNEQPTTTPSQQPTTTPTAPTTTNARKAILKIVADSPSCTKYFWKNRGRAYQSYMNGLAVMYAKQVCGQGSDFIKPNKITSSFKIYSGTYKHNDALAYYGISGSQLNNFTFLIGLGMRESNGKYCKGRDKSQGFTKGSNAEAGIYQMAYVARVFNTEMPGIYADYKAGKKSCELDLFKSPEVTRGCNTYDAKNYGNDEGTKWQALMKRCPAFAVDWASILIRSNYKHFGPIIRKEVEFRTQCRDMLIKVEAVAKNNCSSI